MHILATTSTSLDDLAAPVDLGQAPAPVLVLSFSDSDLAGLEAAWRQEVASDAGMPELRLTQLRELRHPMSVDLWLDRMAPHAKIIIARVLGGYDWWSYGCERLADAALRYGAKLALLPGEDRDDDERLAALSTIDVSARAELLACFRHGGPENLRLATRWLASLAGHHCSTGAAEPMPAIGGYLPGRGAVSLEALYAERDQGRPLALILFYRSMLLAGDQAPISSLVSALEARGVQAMALFVPSLKPAEAQAAVVSACMQLRPDAVATATAFSIGGEEESLFGRIKIPVFQVIVASTRRDAWQNGARGLTPSDVAMHVALPELDGRMLAGALSFKGTDERFGQASQLALRNVPEADCVDATAEHICAWIRLWRKPCDRRRIAVLLPDYPGVEGRAAYAVGLDAPQSALVILQALSANGYSVAAPPGDPRSLMRALERPAWGASLDAAAYGAMFRALPQSAQDEVIAAWGPPSAEETHKFRVVVCGDAIVAIAPDRGRRETRRADYHDPALPPGHALIAFCFWLRREFGADAIVHVGAHGVLEWLPGKVTALTAACWPTLLCGATPVVYPFIVSNPGEAAQAKRRIGAITLGHLTPPVVRSAAHGPALELEQLVEEYASAEALDPRRRDVLAQRIVSHARQHRLAAEAGVDDADDTATALQRIDAWLCDLKDFPVRDGLHVFGCADPEASPDRQASAATERANLLTALAGGFVPPGPSGSPERGRLDVLPTGHNLYAVDPRVMPTPTAFAFGRSAADRVVTDYLQRNGDWPRAMVVDLFGSASLRTGGEEISLGLALLGCKPEWDHATGRVVGIEVLTLASLGRPRVDVTFRASGLFRDAFATQMALLDGAVRAVAAREGEPDDENPLAATRRRGGDLSRIFAPGAGVYGAGPEDALNEGVWESRDEIGALYLDHASHAHVATETDGVASPGAFAALVEGADALVHVQDDPTRDLLDGSADAAFIGGFASAAHMLSGEARKPDLIILDSTQPTQPKARTLDAAVARIVRARATNPLFIEGQMRHGPRGAAELAETVDRLVIIAASTGAVSGELIGAVYDAYLGDVRVRDFLRHQNPKAAQAMTRRFQEARRRDLWRPLRNAIDHELEQLQADLEVGT